MNAKEKPNAVDRAGSEQLQKRKRAPNRQMPQANLPETTAPRTDFKSRDAVVVIGEGGAVEVRCKAGDRPLGSEDDRFIMGLVSQIISSSGKGGAIDKPASDFALSVVQAIDPRDEVEAMLAAQIAAVQIATMTFARRLNNVDTIQQQDSAGALLVKLARILPMQMEALKKYRSGGEQRITVQHVTVNEGGQAVVGNVTTGGKADREGGDGEM